MSKTGLEFLVDVGVGVKVERFLRNGGYDVKTIRDLDPGMSDEDIVRIAVAESRMIITMDKDFGELVYHWKKAHSGILLLRMEDATGQEKTEVISRILSEYSAQIKGRFCVYQKGKLRIRRKG